MLRRPPRSPRTDTLFPYTPLFRSHADAVAQGYGLTRHTRVLADTEIGAQREREYDGSVHAGPTLGLRLPLFDWGRGRTARGHADLQIAEAAVRARELDVIRDVKAADARVRTDRKSVVEGKRVSGRVGRGGRSIHKNKLKVHC